MGKLKEITLVELRVGDTVSLAKKCTKCGVIKPLDEYYNSKKGFAGKVPLCKPCASIRAKKYNKTDIVKNLAFEKEGKKYKRCGKCLEIKEITEFYPHGTSTVSKCKPCYTQERRKGTGPEPIFVEDVNGVLSKKCRNCSQVKPLSDFAKSDKGVGGKRSRCIECEKVNWKEYRLSNKEKVAGMAKSWRIRNPEKQAEASKRWRLNNPQKDKVYQNRRKALKSSLRNELTPEDWLSIRGDFGNKCALSGVKDDVTMDHFIPISTGKEGTYKGNVYPLSSFLNNSKHNRNPFEWYEIYGISHGINREDWDSLVEYLASQNSMTVSEFKSHVESCFSSGGVSDD